MNDLDRAGQLASEISDRVYLVRRANSLDGVDYKAYMATLGVPDGTRIYIAVSSTNTWEIKPRRST